MIVIIRRRRTRTTTITTTTRIKEKQEEKQKLEEEKQKIHLINDDGSSLTEKLEPSRLWKKFIQTNKELIVLS